MRCNGNLCLTGLEKENDMSSNSQRVKRQLITMPLAMGGMAAVLWPVSYFAAVNTSWFSGAAFTDMWMGIAAAVTFLGAAGATVGCACAFLEGLSEWNRD
jgi:hypothetical protein